MNENIPLDSLFVCVRKSCVSSCACQPLNQVVIIDLPSSMKLNTILFFPYFTEVVLNIEYG